MPSRFFHPSIICLTILLVVVAIYWPGLYGTFFFDDPVNIFVEGVRMENLSSESIKQALSSGNAGPSGRPVAHLSFALNHFFNGFDPFYFKLTNVVIHCLNSILVFFVIRQFMTTTQQAQATRDANLSSGIIAFIWATHPIQLTSVLYVVQRMTSLSAGFLLAALLLHILARERGGREGMIGLAIAWLIFWPLSYFSKETGLLFPLFVLAWELILRRYKHQGLDHFSRIFAATSALVIAASVIYVLTPTGHWLWSGYGNRSFSLEERLLTEGRVLCFYLGLVLYPRLDAFGLFHDDLPLSTSLLTPWTTLPALMLLAGLVYLGWRTKNSRPLVSFGIAWFLIGHLLESTALPLEIAHEHRNYLPLLGILLAVADTLMHSLERKGIQKTISITLTAAALAYFPLVTALRAYQYGDGIRLTQIEAKYHPNSSDSQYEAGRALSELPESASPGQPIYALARQHYEQAAKLDPHSKLGLLGLIHLACRTGQPAETEWVQELAYRLRTSSFGPSDRNVLFNLQEMAIMRTIDLTRSEIDGLFAAALANPGVSPGVQAMLYSWHADYLWLHEHDRAAARYALEQSLALDPSHLNTRLKLAKLAELSGNK